MGNPKKTNKKPDDIQKYPISKIEPVTSNISFPNNEMSKPKQKTIFGRMKQKFNITPDFFQEIVASQESHLIFD